MGYRIEFDRDSCIGSGACVASNADAWHIEPDGKATLKSAKFDAEKNTWVLEFDKEDLQRHTDTASVCPVNAIHIYKDEEKLL